MPHTHQQIDAYILWLLSKGGLRECDNKRFRQLAEAGIVGAICADGDYAWKVALQCIQSTARYHLLKLNGAGFLLGLDAENSNGQSEYIAAAQLAIQTDLSEAFIEFKKGSTIMFATHGPICGKAGKLGLSLQQTIEATLRARDIAVKQLQVDSHLVQAMVLYDWSTDVFEPMRKEVSWYEIDQSVIELNRQWKG